LRTQVEMPGLTGNEIRRVRLEMLGRGFAAVATPSFCDDGLLRAVKSRPLLPTHGTRWWKVPQIARYSRWLECLLGRALPEEFLRLLDLDLRQEPAGFGDEQVDKLHADGSYLRSVCTLYGPSTIYRDGDAEFSVPPGDTLLMTAFDRARAIGVRCTLHRRPGTGPERAVIVCSFEPRERWRKVMSPSHRFAYTHRPHGKPYRLVEPAAKPTRRNPEALFKASSTLRADPSHPQTR
jgi:hypothetical protein